ncbi:hypothetical protein CGH87_05315 [Vibrio parahaemolyticus]|uniref:hypothetical protein n=1 Tax=Vibrio parahaemolyticus TaxID=670 RepID=UPI000542F537|nr:hypothetical protein [Vibrio parahaemolyticus]EGR3300058.1 hypothetical protein [Vibrio parahaemolyticus]EGR3316997.1 hypothetical protein [Vibrio parahaemolyticus]KHF03832.1 hypothetical protein PO77_21370 [Vibrio parahaemolyticus]TOM01827.1 hypothetical protein CGH87_05315 [Vibrio parahaemolyticus]
MKYAIGLILGLCTAFSYAQDDMNVIFVGDGFTKNNHPAATIYNCTSDEQSCIQYTFNSKSLSALLNGQQLTNNMRNNLDLEATADMNGQHYVISNKHKTRLDVEVIENDKEAKQLTLSYNLVLVSSKGYDKQLALDGNTLTVEGDFYDTLVGIAN